MDELIKSLRIYKPTYYHYSGLTIEEYWKSMNYEELNGLSDIDPLMNAILNGTLTQQQINDLEEDMITDAECGALWNYVKIAKIINLENEIEVIKKELLEDKESWDEGDKLEDIISAYCYYKIGKYQVFSFQIDSTCAYKCMDERFMDNTNNVNYNHNY